MYLGIMSDTHGSVKTTQEAVAILKERQCQAIIHCGDIGSPEVVRQFRGIPTHFVFGNVDGMSDPIRKVIAELGHKCHTYFGNITLEGKKIAFLHGHQQSRFDQELQSGNWDLLCYGHTHEPNFSIVGNTYLLNPGAVFRTTSPSIAIMQIPEMELTTISLKGCGDEKK